MSDHNLKLPGLFWLASLLQQDLELNLPLTTSEIVGAARYEAKSDNPFVIASCL